MSKLINQTSTENTFRYSNETFSGCDMTATITINMNIQDPNTKEFKIKPFSRVLGELQTISYSIHMEKRPVRAIGNVNAKDFVIGPRTIAGSMVFSVFNKHFAEEILRMLNRGHSAGTAYLVDELPPFDLTISAANEYGYRSRLAIYGIRLLNEGQVMSINDVYTENTYQFFATDMEYLGSEKSYERDPSTGLYKLRDNLATNKSEDTLLRDPVTIEWDPKTKEDYDKLMNRKITLRRIVKQPTRPNTKGIVDFSIDPYQEEGTIYIRNSKNELSTIAIKSAKIDAGDGTTTNTSVSNASIALAPERYTAYYERKENKKKSNHVKFDINEYYRYNDLTKYAPIIERLTDNEIVIFSNEPTHNLAAITSENGFKKVIEIKRRRCSFVELDPNTTYVIQTYNNKEDHLKSIEVTATTLGVKDKLFEELRLYCYANSAELAFPDMKMYNMLLDKAKVYAESTNKDTTDSLMAIKEEYMTLIKNLDKNLPNYNELKNEYDLAIKCCNEMIYFSTRLFNDFIDAVNIQCAIPIPKMFLDKQYDNIFTFDQKITSAEFYKNYGNIVQYHIGTPSYNFKNIDGHDNSFRFLGKPGMKHFVESLIGQSRSPRFEFYMMTNKEKDEFIKKDLEKEKISDKDKEFIDTQIDKDIQGSIEDSTYKRAFMINAKKISEPKFMPPEVETIDENILVKTEIHELFNNPTNSEYYLAIATYEDILCNYPVYKIKFTNREEVIAITRIFHGIKADKEYGIWIEDMSHNQLSNLSTFVYNPNFNLDEDELKIYPLKDVIDKIKNIAMKTLPSNIYEDILSIMENDQSTTNYELISLVIYAALQYPLNKEAIVAFLKQMKYFLFTMQPSDNSLLLDTSFESGILKFNSLKTGHLLMYTIQPDSCSKYLSTLKESNTINTTVYGNLTLIIGLSEDKKYKTDLIVVNNKEGYMEVL